MKKVYSLFGAILIAGVCLAQQSNTTTEESKTTNKDAFKLQVENVSLYKQTKNNKAVVNNSIENEKPTISNTSSQQKPTLKFEKSNVEGTENTKPKTKN